MRWIAVLKNMRAPINRIIPFSNVDGPGNRMSFFFQSCPFHCAFCHNPETIHDCVHCGECVKTCPVGALTLEQGQVIWQKELCVQCDTCLKTCPNNASPKITMMSVEDCLNEIKKVQPFIRGITCSGGECMNHAEFMLALFKEVKKLGLSCLIDSNGYYDFEDYEELIAVSDGVMLDVKAWDADFHRQLTKQDNAVVLKNLSWLLNKNKLQEVRTVVLPNYPEQNRKTVEEVAKVLNHRSYYKIIRYRPFGVTEAGRHFCGEGILSEEEAQQCIELAQRYTDDVGTV